MDESLFRFAKTPQRRRAVEQAQANIASLDHWVLFTTESYIVLYSWPPKSPGKRTKQLKQAKDIAQSMDRMWALYEKHYASEPFVRVYPEGRLPALRDVQGTNYCDIGFVVDPKTRRVTIVAAIDNLLKGAAGQALQNLNLTLGLDETTGLL